MSCTKGKALIIPCLFCLIIFEIITDNASNFTVPTICGWGGSSLLQLSPKSYKLKIKHASLLITCAELTFGPVNMHRAWLLMWPSTVSQ